MKITKQSLAAFFIPMLLAIIMFLIGLTAFEKPDDNGEPSFFSDDIILSYCLSCYPLIAGTYLYFVFGLILLSFILPSYVFWKAKQNENYKIESIIK